MDLIDTKTNSPQKKPQEEKRTLFSPPPVTSMSLLNLKPCNHLIKLSVDKTTPTILHSKPISFSAPKANFTLRLPPTLYSFTKFNNQNVKFRIQQGTKEAEKSEEFEYLAKDGEVYQKTLRLVECAMFAAISGLVYVLSNSLTLENYFGCFFALPIVLSSVRWGVAAGRKTMVATVVLLFVLTGPVKALTYMLSHGLLGFTMGSMWRMKASWGVSIFLCTIVRAVGLLASVAVSSLLIGENILSLIIVNVHSSVVYLLTSMGIQSVPSVAGIYSIFGSVLLVNCIFFVFLLHFLYAVFFAKFGMKQSLRLPRWTESAI
ncbi:hypothetical protein Leryth_023907 [Lithospermum erythrorhizon]|nr:hypothetical protein Leryth_023907 [Lithospermum erythrorhizon]